MLVSQANTVVSDVDVDSRDDDVGCVLIEVHDSKLDVLLSSLDGEVEKLIFKNGIRRLAEFRLPLEFIHFDNDVGIGYLSSRVQAQINSLKDCDAQLAPFHDAEPIELFAF